METTNSNDFSYLNSEEEGSKEKPFSAQTSAGQMAITSLVRAKDENSNFCFEFHGIVFGINPDADMDYINQSDKEKDKGITLTNIKDDLIKELTKAYFKSK